MEATAGVTYRNMGLRTGMAKVWRCLKQPRGRRMVLMPTAWPAPTSEPVRMSQRRALGSGRMLAATPIVDSYFCPKQLLVMARVPQLFPNTQLHASSRTFES